LAVFDSLAGAEPAPVEVPVVPEDSADEAPPVDAPEFVDFGESVL
jgi:hypothetical protein